MRILLCHYLFVRNIFLNISHLKLFSDETIENCLQIIRNIFLYLRYCKNVFSKELTKRITGYFFRAISIERGRIIRNLFLLVFRVNEGKRRVLKRSRP